MRVRVRVRVRVECEGVRVSEGECEGVRMCVCDSPAAVSRLH